MKKTLKEIANENLSVKDLLSTEELSNIMGGKEAEICWGGKCTLGLCTLGSCTITVCTIGRAS